MNLLYQLNILDLVLAILCIFFIIKGFNSGLLQELSGIIIFIISLWIAYMLYIKFGNMLLSYIGSQKWSYFLAYIAIFFSVMIIFSIMSGLFQKHLGWKSESWINWLGGGVIGALKAFVLCMIIIAVLEYTADSKPFVLESKIVTFVKKHDTFFKELVKHSIGNESSI